MSPQIIDRPTLQPVTPDPYARLPLHVELFLLAHDDDNGTARINPQPLSVGLAGALLVELWLARRLVLGWELDPTRAWTSRPGHLTIIDPDPTGEPLLDAALATIGRQPQLRTWLRHFATTTLYQRLRANLTTAGVLRHVRRRRYVLARTDTYPATHYAWAVRARTQIRSVIHGYENPGKPIREQPDPQCAALCGLVDTLELAPFLYLADTSTTRLSKWLRHIVDQHDPTIRQIVTAVDATRGDLAIAAMR